MNFFKKAPVYLLVFASMAALSGLVFLRNLQQDVQLRESTLNFARKIKNFVYYEATINNPEGDMLPDRIDDDIISGIKSTLR